MKGFGTRMRMGIASTGSKIRMKAYVPGRVCKALTVLVALLIGVQSLRLYGQTAGEGAISGTVTDTTGAVVSGATVTAKNNATGIATTRTSTSAGLFSITPLLPGRYTVVVSAPGFKELLINRKIWWWTR